VVPWEQSSYVSICLSDDDAGIEWTCDELFTTPGQAWEGITCGDFDGDGRPDVAVGGQNGKVFIAFSPLAPTTIRPLTPGDWTEVELTAVTGNEQWTALRPGQINGTGGIDLVIGGRVGSPSNTIGWLAHAGSPRTGGNWAYTTISTAGVVMLIDVRDWDSDGDMDVFYNDRSISPGSQIMENTAGDGSAWTRRNVLTSTPHKFMGCFADIIGNDGLLDVVGGSGDERTITIAKRQAGWPPTWTAISVPYPANFGNYQACCVADFNGDGHQDIGVSASAATGAIEGLLWLLGGPNARGFAWHRMPVADGIKFDDLICREIDGRVRIRTTEQGDEADDESDLGVIQLSPP